ncbi:MAG: methyltransferase domain-containing protein [Deltaproteobacteria bacterium]|nr:methyltransferase domain-containing protein [Deltaproteobacteria bacterium]
MARSYADQLELAARVTEPAIRQAIQALALPANSRGLDAGCGIGTHARQLCEAIGGRVTGLDIQADHLAAARQGAKQSPQAMRIDFVEGSIAELPFEDGAFDWVWCADTLWPVSVAEPVAVVGELARVVRPGGTLALLYWTSQSLLPGYPQLEARLNQVFVQHTHYFELAEPARHHLRALGWLRAAGLCEPRAQSFVAEHQAPLSDEMRDAIAFCFSMFWEEHKPHLSAQDRAELERICSPGSEDFILDSPDYYCFLTYTLFCARVAGSGHG